MHQFLIIWLLLIGFSVQFQKDDDMKEPASSMANGTIVEPDNTNTNSDRPSLISTEQNLREARSNHFLNTLKNSNVQSQLKKTNPRLLQYFANQENHVFNDIMRKLANVNGTTYNQNPNNTGRALNTLDSNYDSKDSNKSTKDLFYEVNDDVHPDNNNYHKYDQQNSVGKNTKFDTDYESMHAHETQNSDSKDSMSKYAQIKELISNAEDGKNLGRLSSISGHYVPAEPFGNGDFQDLTSCCDQLFHRYGNKNYLHEDIFIIPRMDELPRPPPSLLDARSPLLVGYRPPPLGHSLPSSGPTILDQEQQHKIPIPISRGFPKDKITEIECIDHHLHNGLHGHHAIAAHPIITGSTGSGLAQGPLVPFHSIDPSNNLVHQVHRFDSPVTNRNDPSLHGNLLPVPQHHFETPRIINGNSIASIHSGGYGFPNGYNRHLISPVQANNRLLISNELGMSQRRANYISPPPMFQFIAPPSSPPPTTAPTLLSRKLSLLGKKYLLG